MPQARNEKELYAALRSPIMQAINYVVDKIWNENREVVRVVVYEAYRPKEYERTGEFRDAWVRGTTKAISEKKSQGEFKYAPEEMSVGSVDYGAPDYAQHVGVGPKYYGDSSREYLADIIYNGIKNGSYFGYGVFSKKRDAWAELNRRIGKRKIKQWMKEGMERAGLDVQMHNTALYMTEVD